jgi:hypothetical protein
LKKTFFLKILLIFFFPAVVFSQQFFVEVEDKNISFLIKIRTFEKYNSTCRLKLVDVKIEKSTSLQDGIIKLRIVKDLQMRSIDKEGPHMGSFAFRKGNNLPDGTYILDINNEIYGFLILSRYSVYFDPINCL